MALIGHWPLIENTLDYSGYGNHGELVGTPSLTNGRIGRGYLFNDDSQHIRIPHNEFLSREVFGTATVFSLAGWVYPTAFQDWCCIINKAFGGAWSNATAGLWVSSLDGITFVMGANVNGNPAGSSTRIDYKTGITINKWYHVIGVANGQNLFLYINGVLVGSNLISNITYPRSENTNVITIGRRAGGTIPTQKGIIQDVRVYNHALSEKEIRDLYLAKVLHYNFNDFQEPTTNLMNNSNGTLTEMFAEGTTPPLISLINKKHPFGDKVWRIVFPAGSNTGFVGCRARSGSIPYVQDGRPYTGSVFVKGDMSKIIPYFTGTNALPFQNFNGEIIDGYRRYVCTNNPVGSTGSIYQTFFLSSATTEDIEIFVIGCQLENKFYVTPYTYKSRSGKVTDISDYGYHADIDLQFTPKWESGKIGSGSYYFDGTGKHFRIPNINAPQVCGDEITISYWQKWIDGGDHDHPVISKNPAPDWNPGGNGFSMGHGWGRVIYFGLGNWNGNTGDMGITENQWLMITLTYKKGSGVKVYVDGELNFTDLSFNGEIGSNIEDLYIGRHNYRVGQYKGNIDDIRVYATALTDEDVMNLYHNRMSLDKNGNLYCHEISEDLSMWDETIQAYNLVENGTHKYESNYNFSTFFYDPQGFIYRTSGMINTRSEKYIKVDHTKRYTGEAEFKNGNLNNVNPSRFYFGVECFDKDFQWIENHMVNHYANTRTTLAQPLNNGDTQVHLTSGANWKIASDSVNVRFFAVWDNPDYPEFTYTRKSVVYASISGNTITLNSAWNLGNIPVGTPVANALNGSTYTYTWAVNLLTTGDWIKHGGNIITGLGFGNELSTFRHGTEYIRMLFLLNRYAVDPNPTTWIRNIRFWCLDEPQRVLTELTNLGLNDTGQLQMFNVSEVGPIEGLIGYWPLDGDAKDYSGNNNHGVVFGATTTLGLGEKQAYLFNNSIDSYIDLPNDLGYTKNVSVFVWFKSLGTPLGNYHIIFGGQELQISIPHPSGDLRTGIQTNTRYVSNHGSGCNDGNWHFLGFTFNSTVKRSYIDGIFVGSQNVDGTLVSIFSNRRIGRYGSSSTYATNGIICGVRIYDRALSDEEVGILYQSTNPDTKMQLSDNSSIYLYGQIKEV